MDEKFGVRSETSPDIPEGISSKSSLKEVSKIMYSKFLKKNGVPFIAVLLCTENNIEECKVLGLSSEVGRVAFVEYTGEIEQDLYVTIHELGHCFGKANHCSSKCVMRPNPIELDVMNLPLSEIFDESCRITIENGKFLERIRRASKEPQYTQQKSNLENEAVIKIRQKSAFPDLSLLDTDRHRFFFDALRYYGVKEYKK